MAKHMNNADVLLHICSKLAWPQIKALFLSDLRELVRSVLEKTMFWQARIEFILGSKIERREQELGAWKKASNSIESIKHEGSCSIDLLTVSMLLEAGYRIVHPLYIQSYLCYLTEDVLYLLMRTSKTNQYGDTELSNMYSSMVPDDRTIGALFLGTSDGAGYHLCLKSY